MCTFRVLKVNPLRVAVSTTEVEVTPIQTLHLVLDLFGCSHTHRVEAFWNFSLLLMTLKEGHEVLLTLDPYERDRNHRRFLIWSVSEDGLNTILAERSAAL